MLPKLQISFQPLAAISFLPVVGGRTVRLALGCLRLQQDGITLQDYPVPGIFYPLGFSLFFSYKKIPFLWLFFPAKLCFGLSSSAFLSCFGGRYTQPFKAW